jgi:hypothetical protein
MKQQFGPGKLYSGDNFLADVICNLSHESGGLVGELTGVSGRPVLRPNEQLVLHLPDGRKAFCTHGQALASGAWLVHISRIE